jgi:protein-S-isoprenylcysteine O-methyltransferase Ste14
MSFFPQLQIGWLNGWLPLLVFYLLFGAFLLSSPRPVVRRLYDLPWFSGRLRVLWFIGRIFALGLFALLIFSALRLNNPVFVFGIGIYALGVLVIFWALFNYRSTPLDRPVTGGIYTVSRNPQALGLMLIMLGDCFAVGSWLAVLTCAVMIAFYHLRVVGEERLCLEQYGDSYRSYMQQVPRYFLFI